MVYKRFYQIDLLRGMACLMVVVFHYFFRAPLNGWVTAKPPEWLAHLASYGFMGVHLFFMISGFVILMSAQDGTVRRFLSSRVVRLYPAFWAGVLLTSFCAWLIGGREFSVSPLQTLLNLTMLAQWLHVEYVDGVYWSLAVEVQFYLLMTGVLMFGGMRHIDRWILGWLVVASVFAMRPIHLLDLMLDARWAAFFVSGMVFYRISRAGWNLPYALMLVWAWGLQSHGVWKALGEVARTQGEAVTVSAPVVVMLLGVFHLVFIAIVQGWWRMAASPLVWWCGVMTYPVYLLHQNIGCMLMEMPFWGDYPLLVRAAVALEAVLWLAWWVHRHVEQPLGRWMAVRLSPVRTATARPQPAELPEFHARTSLEA